MCRVSAIDADRARFLSSVSRTRKVRLANTRSATLTRARTTNGRGWKSKPTMCDTGNLARASHFVYEAIKSRQLGLRRFDFRSPDGLVAFVGFIIGVLYLGAT